MAGIKSFGAILKVATNVIGKLTDVNLGGVDVSMIDVTAQDSTGGYKEYVGGLKDGGQLEMTGNYDIADTGQVYLRANAGATAAFELTFSNGSTATGNCIVGGYAVTNPLDNKVGFTCPLKITGPVTYAAAP